MKTINFTWNNCGTRHKLDIDPKKGENTRSKKNVMANVKPVTAQQIYVF